MNAFPAYSIRRLIHAYDGRAVVDIPELDIPAGGIYAVVGPNGCGKTTFLSILALLLTPSSGSVRMFGSEIVGGGNRDMRRNVTLVHQRPILFSTTVWKNIAYGLRAKGLACREIKQRVQAMLEETGLAHVAEKQARKLSGGEAQRAVLARALVLGTPIVLLDEPTNSLDADSKPIVRNLLLKAQRIRGTTIILATHDLNFVSSLNARVFRMDEGKIRED